MQQFFIIIPTRDRLSYLSDLLLDLNNFSESISKVVIVDQSKESVINAINQLPLNFAYVVLENERSNSVNHSRNLALTQYNGEDWLFFLDDDLRILSGAFEQILKYLKPNIIDVLIPGILFEGMENEVKYSSMLDTIAKPKNFAKGRFRLQVSSGLNIVKKEVFYEAGFYFDENFTIWGDDWDYGMRLLQAGANIYYQPQILVEHLHAPSGGQKSKAKELNVEVEKLKLYFYFIRKHFSEGVLKKEYYYLIIANVFAFKIKQLKLIFKSYQLSKKIKLLKS